MYTLTCSESAVSQTCSGDPEVCTITCTSPEWSVVPGLLPPLSLGDALVIGSAICGVWGLAVAARMLRRFVKR